MVMSITKKSNRAVPLDTLEPGDVFKHEEIGICIKYANGDRPHIMETCTSPVFSLKTSSVWGCTEDEEVIPLDAELIIYED